MSNVLPAQTIQDIRKLAADGLTIRGIGRALGISTNTVSRYYSVENAGPCGCGRNAGHRGWCKVRYAKSMARQAFHASRAGRIVSVPAPIRISRISAQRKKYLRWLGLDESHKPKPLSRPEMYSVIGETTHATRRFDPQFREDVTQEVIAGAIEGRIHRDEIKAAAKFFVLRAWAAIHSGAHVSIDQIAGNRGYDVFLVDRQSGHPGE